ncbi:pyruvate formate lyase activating enzyme [Natronincola peptidivorans]|uniref:Pyruvate formate lyase activating enzyme n=1 Tax=Natronincola peptidivorans TaxID=426128 RepID=A0A1I0DN60_9FIRM|nr:AmmeMemoRadiSam system radical SAM enzyme [Natronincola peptidivorans]SET33299.1 pyruvate formate lyase activating enzyme [Natronincola peptidivorans]
MREALYYEVLDNKVHCMLCPHHCRISNDEIGKCGVRKNIHHKLYSMNYGKLSAIHVDPIEKKPIHQFMQNTNTLSIGSYGCNLSCSFCQNHSISKEAPKTIDKKPEEIVNLALEYNLPSISYTYNEPTIYYEYMIDTAQLAQEKGLKNIVVTNGFIETEPLKHLLKFTDAMNIDLKTNEKKTYKEFCDGDVTPVKNAIRIAAAVCHVEVTTLMVTGMNDDLSQLQELFQWLSSVDQSIPLHLSRYFPRYQYNQPATDIEFMKAAKKEADKYLSYVYLGNV